MPPVHPITKRGTLVMVILSQHDYERLVQRQETSLLDFLAVSPLAELDLGKRDPADIGRKLEL